MLHRAQKEKTVRFENVIAKGYPAYTTSAGWLGYSDEKVKHLVKDALNKGFSHIKVRIEKAGKIPNLSQLKVGVDKDDDLRRCLMVREIIDDPENCRNVDVDVESLEGKQAGPTGCVLMVDANRRSHRRSLTKLMPLSEVWDVPTAIDYVKHLAPARLWFIEEPTAPDDALGHRRIRDALKSSDIKVATGEHTPNRMAFKNFFEMGAIDICQLDTVRLGGLSETLTVLLLAHKFGIPVLPHSGAVGLMNYHVGQT